MNYYFSVLKKYAVFTGRARRKEYWMFFLVNIIIGFVLGAFEGIMGLDTGDKKNILSGLYSLAVLVPGVAVGIRRMHDINRSGWFIIIPIYNLVLACEAGTKGPNQYGPDPIENIPGNQSVVKG